MEELQQILSQLRNAHNPEDVFGMPVQGMSDAEVNAEVKRTYMRLLQIADPDFYPTDEQARQAAAQANALLHRFYEDARAKIADATYGRNVSRQASTSSDGTTISVGEREYRIESTLAQGDLSTIYSGTMTDSGRSGGAVVLKLATDPADNDLMQNELRVLRYLHTEPGVYAKHLPPVFDDLRTQDGRMGLILGKVEGFDLNRVKQKYPDGIPQRHIIWVFRRLLSILGYAHSKGVIHGNVEPAHVLLSASDHNIFLLDWAYSLYKPAAMGQGFRALNAQYSAPEVAEKKPPLPASDLYSAGKCMIFLLGGNIETDEMPTAVDERIQRFIKFFVRQSAVQRPQDAWEMYGRLDDLRQEVFGPHQFIEFQM
jgi:serine/threonine protein kinase